MEDSGSEAVQVEMQHQRMLCEYEGVVGVRQKFQIVYRSTFPLQSSYRRMVDPSDRTAGEGVV